MQASCDLVNSTPLLGTDSAPAVTLGSFEVDAKISRSSPYNGPVPVIFVPEPERFSLLAEELQELTDSITDIAGKIPRREALINNSVEHAFLKRAWSGRVDFPFRNLAARQPQRNVDDAHPAKKSKQADQSKSGN